MGVGLNGTITGNGNTGSATGQAIEVILQSGVASIAVEMLADDGTTWFAIASGISAPYRNTFVFGGESTIRLFATNFGSNVPFKMRPTSVAMPQLSNKDVQSDEIYPLGATPVSAGSGNVANASAVAALAATPNVFNYCTGFSITAAGATAAAIVVATLTGTAGGTLSYIYAAPAGVTLQGPTLAMEFFPPLRSSAVNTAITITLPALGAGNTNAAANIHGYRR